MKKLAVATYRNDSSSSFAMEIVRLHQTNTTAHAAFRTTAIERIQQQKFDLNTTRRLLSAVLKENEGLRGSAAELIPIIQFQQAEKAYLRSAAAQSIEEKDAEMTQMKAYLHSARSQCENLQSFSMDLTRLVKIQASSYASFRSLAVTRLHKASVIEKKQGQQISRQSEELRRLQVALTSDKEQH